MSEKSFNSKTIRLKVSEFSKHVEFFIKAFSMVLTKLWTMDDCLTFNYQNTVLNVRFNIEIVRFDQIVIGKMHLTDPSICRK